MKRTVWKLTMLSLLLALCAVLFAGCGKQTIDLGAYFSKEEIESWDKEEKTYKYTMNGGYCISFRGELYPVEFEDGVIRWLVTPPKELLYVRMNELFSDPSLRNRVAYMGSYEQERLFNTSITHIGYLLDGKRVAYGTVLYMDETDFRQVSVAYGSTPLMGVDEEIKLYRYSGERAQGIFVCGRLVVSDETGTFLEELNTLRKIYEYSIENDVAFDACTEYSGIPYPSTMFTIYDNIWWEEDDSGGLQLSISTVEFASEYHISLRYGNEGYQDLNCIVFDKASAMQEFYRDVIWAIENPDKGSYQDVVMDEQGRITQCYDKYFYGASGGKDNGAQVHKIFYSLEEFNRFLAEQTIVDYENQVSLHFSRQENGAAFDGFMDYQANCFPTMVFSLYAVWSPYHVVSLHTEDGVMEQIICVDKDLILPNPLRPGYEFEGWYTDESYSGKPITHVGYTDGYTDLYAKFREVEFYTLTFEPFEGQTQESVQYAYGDEFLLPYLSKPFHVFLGWCSDPECKTEPQKMISSAFFGSYHLYPAFEPLPFTITVIVGEKMLHTTVCYGENYTLLTYAVEDGFIGYFDEFGVQYTDAQGRSLVPFEDGADIVLYAKYKEEST